MRVMYYILDEQHKIVPADLVSWSKFYEEFDKRRVATYDDPAKKLHVSTVFIGLPHLAFSEDDEHFTLAPIDMFESRVWGGYHDATRWYYDTWDEAVQGHTLLVRIVERDSFMPPKPESEKPDA